MKRWSMKALLLAAAVSAAADPPYLPASGPAPLRFSHPVARKTPALQLPPLPTVDLRPPEPATPASSPSAMVSNPPPDIHPTPGAGGPGGATNLSPAMPEVSGPLPPPPPFNPVVTNGIELVRPDTENLTPQMFMKFFSGRPGTNASGISIIAPMPFVPPAPPAPSSTATFQTTPPSKP